MKVVIVGGSAGGASVAARLRRLNEAAEIVLFEKGSTISFANCGIPYYLGGVIKDRKRLNVVEQDEFEKILGVTVRTHSEVVAIDRDKRKVTVKNLRTNRTLRVSYDKLVLAPGGQPVCPRIPGIDSPHVFTLRNAESMDAAKEFIAKFGCRSALVIGAGFIGLEMAENLSRIGLKVNIIDMSDQVMGAWDYEMATVIHHHLRSKGVNLILNDSVAAISDRHADLNSGNRVDADIIFLCIGVVPDAALASACGLSIGETGGIRVNDGLITSDENIFALGDAVEVRDRITHNQSLIPLAGIAHKQARVVAENICGMHRVFKDVQITAIAKVFDLTVSITGRSERSLIENSVGYKKSYVEVPSHASYYPDAHPMIFKLLFAAKTGRILGAQIIGAEGVDKRIDIIGTAINFGKTVYDLIDLELAYAPPFSSAKDPVNIAGMVAKNMLREDYRVVHWDQLDTMRESGAVFIDVRTPEEFELQSIEGAINIPLTELHTRLDEIPTDKTIVVYCQQGKKGYFAYKILTQHGYGNVFNVSGGLKIYHLITMEKNKAGVFDGEEITSNGDIKTAGLHLGKDIVASVQASLSADVIEIDACGLSCPGPIMKLTQTMKKADSGDIIRITATDMGFAGDVETWTKQKGHRLIALTNENAKYTAVLQKCV